MRISFLWVWTVKGLVDLCDAYAYSSGKSLSKPTHKDGIWGLSLLGQNSGVLQCRTYACKPVPVETLSVSQLTDDESFGATVAIHIHIGSKFVNGWYIVTNQQIGHH